MSKYLLLFSSLIILLVSCDKETPVDPPADDVVFAGDYSIAAISKIHHISASGWSESRVINTLGDTGSDYRRHIEFPDSGGGAGYTDEETYDVDLIASNFSFSDAYEWEMALNVELTRVDGENTLSIYHELFQSGNFEILFPGVGAEHDFNLMLNFEKIESEMISRVYNADDEIVLSIEEASGYEDAKSVRSSIVFEATLTDGELILEGVVYNDYEQDYSNNTYIINEGLVDLTLQLK